MKINNVDELRRLDRKQLEELAAEIRSEIIGTTSKTGGHLAPSLGVVELTIALHYVFKTPEDRIVWDVGHQSYAHKILTGRREIFSGLRQKNGISGFPKRSESIFDSFGTGHSSTSISAALGIAAARDLNDEDFKVVAVIGDGSMTGGLAFEGLNNAGHLKKDILVVLNDNNMFISGKVGALGEYLARILASQPVYRIEERVRKILEKYPRGKDLMKLARRSKVMLTPGMFFEEIGFEYFGPVDGHDTEGLIEILRNIKKIRGPKLLHVVTKKGRGYPPAEENPEGFHGTSPFDPLTGKPLGIASRNFQDAFGDVIVELAESDEKIIAITAAMECGTGLKEFAAAYPERFFDVGIAEQHAVTFAAGLAAEGHKPVCAIYSTFLQRSYDQIIHDVALQGLPVIFAVDRAGLVGEDGPTHHGVFDLSYLCSVPDMIVAAPADETELRDLFYSASLWGRPSAIRYPRGQIGNENPSKDFRMIDPGNARVLSEGKDLAILAIGSMVSPALKAAGMLEKDGIDACVLDLRFANPLDSRLIIEKASTSGKVLTVEENILTGGVGQRIAALLPRSIEIDCLAVPDSFVECGTPGELREMLGLSAEGIAARAASLLKKSGK